MLPAPWSQMLRSSVLACALLVAAVYGGICNDKRTDCANWARDGECSGDNAVSLATALRSLACPPAT